MPFIGNQPAESYSAFQKQDFSTSATTSYTLDHPVSNQNEIALFINFVRQEPTTAYTASGTSLTLTSATSSSDDMYCVYLGKAVQTVNPPSGSVGSSQVAASIITGQTAETSIATDDTVLIHDTSAGALRKMTRANFVSGIGGTNTPAWMVKLSSAQSISNATSTLITFDQERFDTDGAYDNSTNYRFTVPSGEGGKYFVFGLVSLTNFAQNKPVNIELRKNGSGFVAFQNISGSYSDDTAAYASQIFDASAGDYFDATCFHRGGSSFNANTNSCFGGFKLL